MRLHRPAGRYIAEKAQALTDIIEGYEEEQEPVCAQFPQCHDDGNVWRDFDSGVDGMLSADGNHLASAGQAHMAEFAWPTFEAILAERSGAWRSCATAASKDRAHDAAAQSKAGRLSIGSTLSTVTVAAYADSAPPRGFYGRRGALLRG